MAATSVKGDTAVAQRTTTAPPQLCACCQLHPVSTGTHDHTVDTARLRRFAADTNLAVAHVAGVGLAFASEVEEWKHLAAAETDPARAENFRKGAAVAAGMVAACEVLAQDVKAVSEQ